MPKQVDPNAQRDEIRAAARRVFSRRGVRGTGLAHVAEAAGMGRSSLYHYYPDKQALLADLVREMLEQERLLFSSCLQGEGTPLARIDRLLAACARLFPEWAAFGRMILDLRLEDVASLGAYFGMLRDQLVDVITEGQADGSLAGELDAPLQASILIAAIDGLLLQHFADPSALPEPGVLAEALRDAAHRLLTR
ncbi:MAG: TetR/AcrR family transcriptional regulator [Deltaproteobacteria bacterium]|nr:TetR/AcrR family transcriptional regulator [Deltaproteobacteria bacterium]MBW2396969.1 TetR/AcrR family transcriptional regulator [Deltaproteobacteria bacterium]